MIYTVKFWVVYGALLASVLAFVVAMAGGEARRVWNSSRPLSRMVFFSAVAAASIFAVSKPGSVSFPFTDPEVRYLYDEGSYVTNNPDRVVLKFTRLQIIPNDADLLGYWATSNTEGTAWTLFYSNKIGSVTCPLEISFAGAPTNHFAFLVDWTPASPVHTNGVAVIGWAGKTGVVAQVSMPYTSLHVDGAKLLPPPAITNGPGN